jgi:hypothetical protein
MLTPVEFRLIKDLHDVSKMLYVLILINEQAQNIWHFVLMITYTIL